MIITVSQPIPQTVDVQTSAFSVTPTITAPMPMAGEVSFVGIPGPPGPPGPSGGTTIHVASTPPSSPAVNDLWVDTT